MRIGSLLLPGVLLLSQLCAWAAAAELPGRYFRLLEQGIGQVEERLSVDAATDLQALEARPAWRHFPSAVLMAAVLYAKSHPTNERYRDGKMLSLALKIGDLLVTEQEKGRYATRLDHHRDTYMWLEAYRLLEPDLGDQRRERWRRALLENLNPLASEVAKRQDYPWYQSPFIGTSPNHYSLWSSTLYLAGLVFGNPEWKSLGARVMHRFAAEEQTPDGFWGEHSRSGPTTGYDYLTATGVALYWEHSGDKAALEALRRSTDFHMYYTYPDGRPVETINDRNRHWEVSMWSHFGFSHFSQGRRYAQFLTGFYPADRISLESLGRIAQNALYYHEGPSAPIPQDQPHYLHQMTLPAGIRKAGPWVICLSGLTSTQAVTSRFYLDRQGHLSVFHQQRGLIVTGANSKRQPELATFFEKLIGQTIHMPISSRLQMSEEGDRLSLAYNAFFNDLYVPPPLENDLTFRFSIMGKGQPPEQAQLTLQLCLKAGETLETAAGKKIVLGAEPIELQPGELSSWIRHHGWTLKIDPTARLVWPVYPHNPYTDAPETSLEHAVGALSVPLRLQAQPGHYVRPREQEIAFTLTVP